LGHDRPLNIAAICGGMLTIPCFLRLSGQLDTSTEVSEQGLDRELAAAGALEDLGGREPAAVPVNVLAQPAAERGQIALADLRGKVAQVAVGGLPELAGDDVAEAVGREVAECARRPVDVLQHAVSVVGNLES